jgi:hypothetical protein
MMFFIKYFLKDTLYKLFYMHLFRSDYKLIYRHKILDNQKFKLTKEKPKLVRKSILPTQPVDCFLHQSINSFNVIRLP